MKLIKPFVFSASVAVLLSSCGSTSVLPIDTKNIDQNPVKTSALSQEQLEQWGHFDLVTDTVPGMSVNKAYDLLLKGKKGKTVVVGVIDSGVDIEHEDLKNVLWTNPNEIPNNGKDDDNNGYIDDIHGWNFLGQTNDENLEYVRILKTGDTSNPDYQRAQAEYDKDYASALEGKNRYEKLLQTAKDAHEAVSKALGKEEYTKQEVAALKPETEAMQNHIGFLTQMFQYEDSITGIIKDLKSGVTYYANRLNYNLGKDFHPRKLVGDNIDDLTDTKYGDNNVIGPDKDGAKHGTHVAGIIAAERNNNIGMNGVANNARIMTVRAVPNGDEYDKDIALAIRYAVDNGATVLNTSFGKYYSPHVDWVHDAIKYAASKDVLIVNAAGNDALDIDTKDVYPNDGMLNEKEIADNFITVGALNYKYGSELVANFSNYGVKNVDVFAPGVKIYSTIPDNKYQHLRGTSMAAPNVAGVAALIRSYYPSLTAAQVKTILMQSGLPLQKTVILGGDNNNTKSFSTISKSGKIVNAYNALLLAKQVSKGQVKL